MRPAFSPRLLLVTLAHFTIDGYSSFLSPLLPLLIARLDLSLTEVGTLVALGSFSSSLSQPLFGWLSDRIHRFWFVAFGPLVAAVFMSSVGIATSFPMLAALLMLGGLGVAAFHPQAAVLAGTLLGRRRGAALSFFVTGGTLGFAFGPLFAVGVVGGFGLERSFVAAIPGLLVAALLLHWFAHATPAERRTGERASLSELRPLLRPLTALYFAGVFRSAVSFGFMTFLPIYLHQLGFTVAMGGVLVSVYLAAGAVGAFAGGWLADRWGGRRMILFSFAACAPLYFAFLLLPPGPAIVSLVLGNLLNQSALPVNVTMGQELAPRHSSTVSSMLMGAAWGIGQLLAGPTGALADSFGLRVALGCLAALLPLGWLCALQLPDVHPTSRPVEVTPAAAAGE